MIDVVNHPSHYETGKFECIDVMEEALGGSIVESFCIANAFKYLYRSQRKNGDEDIFKAQWYLNKWAELRTTDNGMKNETDIEILEEEYQQLSKKQTQKNLLLK